jgi:hypothetical protein
MELNTVYTLGDCEKEAVFWGKVKNTVRWGCVFFGHLVLNKRTFGFGDYK